jgi:hypothetical protein
MKCLMCGANVPAGVDDCPNCGCPSPENWFRSNQAPSDHRPTLVDDPDSPPRGETEATEDLLTHSGGRGKSDLHAGWPHSGE